jgi:hypothetical protein
MKENKTQELMSTNSELRQVAAMNYMKLTLGRLARNWLIKFRKNVAAFKITALFKGIKVRRGLK